MKFIASINLLDSSFKSDFKYRNILLLQRKEVTKIWFPFDLASYRYSESSNFIPTLCYSQTRMVVAKHISVQFLLSFTQGGCHYGQLCHYFKLSS